MNRDEDRFTEAASCATVTSQLKCHVHPPDDPHDPAVHTLAVFKLVATMLDRSSAPELPVNCDGYACPDLVVPVTETVRLPHSNTGCVIIFLCAQATTRRQLPYSPFRGAVSFATSSSSRPSLKRPTSSVLPAAAATRLRSVSRC